ncbi:MAG: elongation factor G [Synergistaceae bacterium]|nr:elongation factor G [Synergistaceae bacterium]
MATRNPEDIRTVALVSHGGAGKTSLVEAFLFDAGIISRMGKIEDKNTVADFDPEEQKRQISINSALITFPHKGKTIHILDTPGFADFAGEQLSAMRVVDSAVLLVSGVAGIEVQTQRNWEYSEEFQIPVIFYVSKMDREHADFTKVVGEIQDNFTNKALPLFLPIGEEAKFKGVVDLIRQKAYIFKRDGSKTFDITEIPDEMLDEAVMARDQLVERIVEADDVLMERYLDDNATFSQEELEVTLRKAVIQRILFPILPGATTLNIGVIQLLDTIADVFPAAVDMRPRRVMVNDEITPIAPDANAPFYGLCFKIMVDPYVGKLSFVRVFSGKLRAEQGVYNVNKGEEERVGSFRFLRGKEGEESKEVLIGDIIAIPKLESTGVGTTLSVKGQTGVFWGIPFPKPVYSLAISPKSRADEDKLGNAIHKILEEDRTLSFRKNPETGDAVFSGMGDMHLDIMLSRIKERYKVDLETKTPKVPYRETIKKKAKAQGKYKKQTGGRGQYGDVHFELSPLGKGDGIRFEDRVVGGVVPKNFIPAAEKGLREAALKGVLAGYPAVDFNCAIFDGSYHDVDSSEMAFKIAASMAFKKAFSEAAPILMEPIMDVVVTVPEECLGDVMGDFNSRRGRIAGIDSAAKLQIVKAQCPLSEMFRYAILLRSMTSGRGNFTMEFSHYEEVPAETAKKIIEKAAKERKDDED